MKPNPHPVSSSIRKRIIDFFERPNTSSDLGINNDGSRWDLIKGIFFVSGQRARTQNNPEEYPIATIQMSKSDVNLFLYDIDNGSGASLWVTDSGNWFAVGVDQHPVDCNCEVGTECNRWNSSNITGWTTTETGGRNAFTAQTGETCTTRETGGRNVAGYTIYGSNNLIGCRRYAQGGRCIEWYRYSSYEEVPTSWNSPNFTTTCNANFSTRYNAPNFTSNINGYNAKTCNRWNEFTFNCETCYPQWIRILQSTGGTVTTLAKYLVSEVISIVKSPNGTLDLYVQENPIVNFVKSLILQIRGKQISIEAFSDPGAIDKINIEGDEQIVYTPTGAVVEPKYGIIVVPSEYNQQNFIGGIQVTRDDV